MSASERIGTYRTKADADRALRWQLKGQRGAPKMFQAHYSIKVVKGMSGGKWYELHAFRLD